MHKFRLNSVNLLYIHIKSISKFYIEKIKMIILLQIFLIFKLIKADCPFKETTYNKTIIIKVKY